MKVPLLRSLLVASILIGVGFSTLALVTDPAEWKEMIVTMEQVHADKVAERHIRSAPYGETADGEAWEHYLRATAAILAIPGADAFAVGATAGTVNAAARNKFVADAEVALAHLRLGAASGNATAGIDWSGHRPVRTLSLRHVGPLIWASVAKMEILLEQGRPEEAVRCILDAQQLAADLLSAPHRELMKAGSVTLVPQGLAKLLTNEHYPMLTASAKARWWDGLVRIMDGIPPSNDAFRGELVSSFRIALSIIRSESRDVANLVGRGWGTWRPDFIWNLAFVDFVKRADAAALALDAAFLAPPSRVVAEAKAATADLWDKPNPLVNKLLPDTRGVPERWVDAVGRITFLRHAIALDISIEDPLPSNWTEVQVERVGEQIHIYLDRYGAQTIEVTLGQAKD